MSEIGVCVMFLAATCFPFVFAFGAFGVMFIGQQFQWWKR